MIDMRLDLRLTHRFLDQLWCQAIVVFLFEDISLQKEYLSRINKALAGSLTPLIENHFITGKKGDLILIAPQERIKAEKLLFVGLGPVSGYSVRILPLVARKLVSSLDRLHVDEFCIMVPRFDEDKKQYEEFVKSMIHGTISYYEKRKREAVSSILKVLVSIDEDVCPNMRTLQESLRSYLDPCMEYTIVIDESKRAAR
jgi:leucyl aminopeptidase